MPKIYCDWGKVFTGESTDDAHVDWSELINIDFNFERMMSMGSGVGGLTRGAVNSAPLQIAKKMDKADSDLLKFSGSGEPIPSVIVEVVTDSKDKIVIIKLIMTDCVIGGCSFGVSGQEGSDAPIVSTSVGYQKIEFEYTAIKQDGAKGSTYKGAYDLKTNKVS